MRSCLYEQAHCTYSMSVNQHTGSLWVHVSVLCLLLFVNICACVTEWLFGAAGKNTRVELYNKNKADVLLYFPQASKSNEFQSWGKGGGYLIWGSYEYLGELAKYSSFTYSEFPIAYQNFQKMAEDFQVVPKLVPRLRNSFLYKIIITVPSLYKILAIFQIGWITTKLS